MLTKNQTVNFGLIVIIIILLIYIYRKSTQINENFDITNVGKTVTLQLMTTVNNVGQYLTLEKTSDCVNINTASNTKSLNNCNVNSTNECGIGVPTLTSNVTDNAKYEFFLLKSLSDSTKYKLLAKLDDTDVYLNQSLLNISPSRSQLCFVNAPTPNEDIIKFKTNTEFSLEVVPNTSNYYIRFDNSQINIKNLTNIVPYYVGVCLDDKVCPINSVCIDNLNNSQPRLCAYSDKTQALQFTFKPINITAIH